MKKLILVLLFVSTVSFDSQKNSVFDVGEKLTFRVHYGFVNAGYATLEVKEGMIHSTKVFHVVGKGYTTGVSKFFFKVDDLYESYIDKISGNPYQYIRKIDEGGYIKNQEGFFNQAGDRILVKDYKHKTEKVFVIPENTQDILSSFYYFRNDPNIDKMKPGEFVDIDMFFDNEIVKFRLKYIGSEAITTKFGIVSTMVFSPLVQSGRIFEEEESLTIWISDDENRIPLRIKANLVVGSIKADLEEYKGLKFPFRKK